MNKTTHPIEPEELMAYLDGELSSDRIVVAAAHLSECAECQALITDLRGVSHMLGAWDVSGPESEVPLPIATALIECKPERGRVAGAKSLPWRETLGVGWQTAEWLGALAIILVVVVGTVRFIGRNANTAFSQVGSKLDDTIAGSNRDRVELRASQGAAPVATPTQDKQFGRLDQFAKLQKAPPVKFRSPKADEEAVSRERSR